MKSKKGLSIFKIFLVIVCIIFITLSLAINILFSRNNTPKIFGKYVYLLNNDDMGNYLPNGTAIIAQDAKDINIKKGDLVLCKLNDSDVISIRSIYKINTDETTGVNSYYPATATEQGTELSIPRENIVAICNGGTHNQSIGKYISFSIQAKGLLLQLILPSVLLVIFLIIKIAGVKEDDEDTDASLYDYENTNENSNAPQNNYNPYANDEFERKKQSIAENFSQKEVNPDSPYQKEKGRTMQFKTTREATGTFQRPNANTNKVNIQNPLSDTMQMKALRSAESSFAARNMPSQSSTAPIADSLRNEIHNEQIRANAPQRPVSNSNTPNIDDIIQKTDMNQKKKDINSLSVDDLLNMIENEKKRL